MHISELLKTPTVQITHRTEYGDLISYFINLGMKDRNGRLLSRGAIGFFLMPYIIKNGKERNYTMLYALKAACENSKNPQAVFWINVRNKKK